MTPARKPGAGRQARVSPAAPHPSPAHPQLTQNKDDIMSKPNRKRYRLSEVREQFTEAVGGATVEFETDSGDVLTFPHPLFTDDEWDKKVDGAETSHEKAVAILGEEQYEKYRAAGHADSEIGLLMLAVQQDMQGQIKGRPTRR